MSHELDELLDAVKEIRELLRLVAEPAIAARDQTPRAELRRIVGKSGPRAKAVLLMNGVHSQSAIRAASGMQKGNLSTFVKRLTATKLVSGDSKQPKLTLSLPSNFFDAHAEAE